ncbi:MAG: cyclic nucleotide-binding domain-containing protein [Chloroflexota bacterium]
MNPSEHDTTVLLQEALSQFDLLQRDISPDVVNFILSGTVDERSFHGHQTLFNQDDTVRYIYLLLEGQVRETRLTRDRAGRATQSLLCERGPGSFLGLYDLLYRQQHSTNVRAISPGRYIRIDAAAISRLTYRYPTLRYQIVPLDRIGRLRTIPFLSGLTLTEVSFLGDNTKEQEYVAEEEIYREGSRADAIYLIDQGQVKLTWPDGHTLWLANGAAFGFEDRIWAQPPQVDPHADPQANGFLNYAQQRHHHAEAIIPTKIFVIKRQWLIDIANLFPEEKGPQIRQAFYETLHDISVFRQFEEQERLQLAGYMDHCHLPNHYLIAQQGEISDAMWMLMPDSHAKLHAIDEDGQTLPPAPIQGPTFFNEVTLRTEVPMDSTIEAEPRSQWIRLNSKDFKAFLENVNPSLLNKLDMTYAMEEVLGEESERQRYEWLQSGEKLLMLQHRHWFALFKKINLALLLLAVLVLPAIGIGWYAGILTSTWMQIYLACVGIPVVAWLIWGIVDYQNDYLVVTSQRVVRQERVVFVSEWRQIAMMEQIQNIDIVTTFTGRLFGYGDVKIQTSGVEGQIDFDYVPDPDGVRDAIFEQREWQSTHTQASSKKVIHALLEERLGLKLKLPERVLPDIKDDDVEWRLANQNWWKRLWYYLQVSRHMREQELSRDQITWRKHWIILLYKIFTPASLFLFSFVMCIIIFLIPGLLGNVLPSQLLSTSLGFLCFVTAIFSILWSWWSFVDWYNDKYEVDRSQIVDIEKKPLFFAESRRTATMEQIEDIRLSIPSPIHFFFNFGHVRLQTAAYEGGFSFDNVADPRGVAEEIRKRINAYQEKEREEEAMSRAQELPDWFEMYSRLDADRGYPILMEDDEA